jgi:hypothetical protein
LFFRQNAKAISLGPAGNPQFRLGKARLETGETILVNKNVFFDDGRPMKNRFKVSFLLMTLNSLYDTYLKCVVQRFKKIEF